MKNNSAGPDEIVIEIMTALHDFEIDMVIYMIKEIYVGG